MIIYSNPGLHWFSLTFFSVIGPENSHHPLNQSDAKLKPIATWKFAFSRALTNLLFFTLSSYWLMIMKVFVLIGPRGHFGFGFSTLHWKPLQHIYLNIDHRLKLTQYLLV